MSYRSIESLIVNSPYAEPTCHWKYDRDTQGFDMVEGRRPAGYVVASESGAYDDPGTFVEIPLVNQIRQRVSDWRKAGYPGVTAITRRLLLHWTDEENNAARRFFFCQLEAIETLIWLREGPQEQRVGIDIPSDGGEFGRQCCKMATGSGKTLVMAMVIAWQVLNKATYGQDTRFSKNVLVIAPGLTVKSRLSVLTPSGQDSYYSRFDIVPSALMGLLRTGKVLVKNWHSLSWESEEQIERRKSVDKRGAKSDEAYACEVLGDMAKSNGLLVLNDEAHHAWRVNVGAEGKYRRERDLKDSAEEATVWVGGLDRLHRTRGIQACYDFSATPFAPSGKQSAEESLFGWIVSDFGLNDAIESGLVKTPRVVVRDDALPDAETFKSRLYHIYNDPEVKDDLNRRAAENEPLPDLVKNAYILLGCDWDETRKKWKEARFPTPPVMISVCNRIETAARVKHAFRKKDIPIDDLCDQGRLLQIDSSVLKNAEESEVTESRGASAPNGMGAKERAELLRQQIDTIGIVGRPGEQLQNVISVAMLSEGWDAKTVTHIMGLRAFTSQLLCEQVVGRGLRRTSYDLDEATGFLHPEYVNVFGVPFTFLPHEGTEDALPPPPPDPKRPVHPVPGKERYLISWPNVIRIDRVIRPMLRVNWAMVAPLRIDTDDIVQTADLAPAVDGQPGGDPVQIGLGPLQPRHQTLVFKGAADAYEQINPGWGGSLGALLAQLVRLFDEFVSAPGNVRIVPEPDDDETRRRILVLRSSTVIRHFLSAVKLENSEKTEPVYDSNRPISATGDMNAWYTAKPCSPIVKSHINVCVYDSAWESSTAYALDNSDHVDSWVKNDHLGFEIFYLYAGVVRRYLPDFIVKLTNGIMLVLETKGKETDQDRAKQKALEEWVFAVTEQGKFGRWVCRVIRNPSEVHGVLSECASLAKTGVMTEGCVAAPAGRGRSRKSAVRSSPPI